MEGFGFPRFSRRLDRTDHWLSLPSLATAALGRTLFRASRHRFRLADHSEDRGSPVWRHLLIALSRGAFSSLQKSCSLASDIDKFILGATSKIPPLPIYNSNPPKPTDDTENKGRSKGKNRKSHPRLRYQPSAAKHLHIPKRCTSPPISSRVDIKE
jgi:hypothetical protein